MSLQQESQLVEEITEELKAIDSGDQMTNLSIRDEHMAALLRALEDTGNLENVQRAAAEHLEREVGEVSKSSALGLLIRVGLFHVSPDTMTAGSEAYQNYLLEKAGEF
jgi:hypothetical protein